jgi:hypothetical protein
MRTKTRAVEINLALLFAYLAGGAALLSFDIEARWTVSNVIRAVLMTSMFTTVFAVMLLRRPDGGSVLRWGGLYVPFYIP